MTGYSELDDAVIRIEMDDGSFMAVHRCTAGVVTAELTMSSEWLESGIVERMGRLLV